jgi:hypothetical protein
LLEGDSRGVRALQAVLFGHVERDGLIVDEARELAIESRQGLVEIEGVP